MALLQPYQGRFVSARSASEKLDVESILAGCNAVDREANMILSIEKEVRSSGGMITPDILAIDDKNISTMLEEVCATISNKQNTIQTITSNIRQQVEYIYNKIQAELNEEASIRDQAERDTYNSKM